MLNTNNPYNVPRVKLDKTMEIKNYGGIGRADFLWGLSFSIFLLLFTVANTEILAYIPFEIILLTVTVLLLGVIIFRLKNAGYSWIWAFLLFIPIINIIYDYALLELPAKL